MNIFLCAVSVCAFSISIAHAADNTFTTSLTITGTTTSTSTPPSGGSSSSGSTTTMPVVIGPLANPSDFKAQPFSDRVHLSWNNPLDSRFVSVRIVRSESFFPKDEFDGVPVYEGTSQSFNDTHVVSRKTYYYAIFAKGTRGEFSSGALAQAYVPALGEIVISPTSTDPFINIPNSKNVDPQIAALTLADFEFIQEGKVLSTINGQTVAIDGAENITIRLKYAKVPEILKTIAFTLLDPHDSSKVFPFLLRINADKTAYEATLGPLGRSGNYTMSIVVLDYQNQGLKRINGNIMALVFNGIPTEIQKSLESSSGLLGLFLLLLAIILAALILYRHFRHHRRISRPAGIVTPAPVIPTRNVPGNTPNVVSAGESAMSDVPTLITE